MRHSRRAVMTERYKLYMKKNILNSRYFVRNLQITICIVAAVVLLAGFVVLSGSDKGADTVAVNANVSVKEALFGNSEEEKTIAKVTDTEDVTAVTEAVSTERIVTEAATAAEYSETSEQAVEVQTTKSEFDGKCIANVEETLNIRKEPSTEAEFVGSMNPGAIAIVEGTEGDWTKIKSGDVEGYVLSDYILTGESAEQYAKDYVTLLGTVLEDGVNVRTEESTDAEILTVLEKDDTITVLENEKADNEEKEASDDVDIQAAVENAAVKEEAAAENTEEPAAEQSTEDAITWLPVMLEDGQTGYVSADFVDVDRLYEIAVSAEELERQAAEKAAAEEAARKAAEEEAARQAAAAANNNTNSGSNGNNGNSDSYKGATTTPVTATESGECIGTFTITAYCGCKKCSGGHNKTASGTTPTEGRTIAADTSILPYGTQVVIDGIVYTVEDCGSGVNGNHIDIFFSTHEKALAYGTKTVKVYKY